MAAVRTRAKAHSPRTITGGRAVVETLEAEGVEAVFGIPGVHNLPIYDALAEGSSVQHHLARHEQGAVFMADAYARVSGRVGVVLTTTGPGVTNALTALANAYTDSSPLVFIATSVSSPNASGRWGALHELKDQHGLLSHTVSAALLVERPEEIEATLHRAFRLARGGRPGPVSVEIPVPFLLSQVPAASGNRATPEKAALQAEERQACYSTEVGSGSPELRASLEQAAAMLLQARYPLVYLGGGAAAAGVEEEARELVELLGAPVLFSLQGRGVIPDSHPLALGTTWRLEPTPDTYSGLWEQADLWLAIGTAFDAMNTGNWTLPVSPNLVQIDIDPAQIGRNYPARVGLPVDARVVLPLLLDELRAGGYQGSAWRREQIEAEKQRIWQAGQRHSPPAFALMEMLRQTLSDDAIIALDSTIAAFWMIRFLPLPRPRSLLFSGLATLGFGLPAAIGAKLAEPQRPVVAVAGDGGFLFTLEELAAAMQARVSVPIIVVNDQRFGMIKAAQELEYDRRYIAVDLTNPDFVKLARAFGAQGYRLESTRELPDTLRDALAAPGPTLIELPLALDPPLF